MPTRFPSADDVRIVGILGTIFRRAIAASLIGASRGSPFLVMADKEGSHVPINVHPFRFKQLRATHTHQREKPDTMPRIVVVFVLQRLQEARHLDGRDESLPFSLAESHDARDWAHQTLRDEPSYLAPVEHLADSFQEPVRPMDAPISA